MHQIISSLSGLKGLEQIGQSPETSLRSEGDKEVLSDIGRTGAPAKMVQSCFEFGLDEVCNEGLGALLLTEEKKETWPRRREGALRTSRRT